MYCGLSTVFHALALSFIQKCGDHDKSSKQSLQIFYLSSIFSFPVLLVVFFFSGEPERLVENTTNWHNSDFLINLTLVICFGCLLCYSQFWCCTSNSALTTSVIGVLKSFIQTMLGIFVFKAQYTMTYLAFLGIFVNLVFGTYYTYLKYVDKEEVDVYVGKKSPKPTQGFNIV